MSAGPIDAAGVSSVGGREENQDRFHVDDELAVVSDGMGGYEGGAKAAGLATAAVVEAWQYGMNVQRGEAGVIEAFQRANDDVRAERDVTEGTDRMGATLVVAVRRSLDDDASTWVLAHVGDSPGYLVTAEGAAQLTIDHTLPALLLQDGVLTPDEAEQHPYKNVLLRAIGAEPEVEVDVNEIILRTGEALVLCSDGLSGMLTADEIGDLVRGAASASAAAEVLVSTAVTRGASDNVTSVVIRHRPSTA